MDFLGYCLDEITLEGLDGVTIAGLWVRLADRQPAFPIKLDDRSKSFLWRSFAVNEDLEFFVLPEERPLIDLCFYKRYDDAESETGTLNEVVTETLKDLYPVCAVPNQCGSCATYNSRVNITSSIRNDSMLLSSLEDTCKKWGEHKVVIVSSSEMRKRTLFGPEIGTELALTDRQFVILERIGRARHYGEITHGPHSLMKICDNSSKGLFYIKKSLTEFGLIKSQPVSIRTAKGQNTSAKVLRLSRFDVKNVPFVFRQIEKICKILQEKPNQVALVNSVRADMKFSEKGFKKIVREGCKYFKFSLVKYREIFPDATPKEYNRKSLTNVEKQLRVLKLIKMYSPDDESSEDEDEDEDGENIEKNVNGCITKNDYRVVLDKPLLQQAYDLCEERGSLGITQCEIGKSMGLGKLESRLLCRNMERMNAVKMMLQDKGRQRVQRYVSKKYELNSELTTKFETEKMRILKNVKETAKAVAAASLDENDDVQGGLNRKSEDQVVRSLTGQAESEDSSSETDRPKQSLFLGKGGVNRTSHMKKGHAHVTFRMLKRANLVIQIVREAKLIDRYSIQKKIIMEEEKEGLTMKLCRKSLERLIERLAREGQVKSIKTLLKYGKNQKLLHFVCDPSMANNDPLVLSTIEQAKFRYVSIPRLDLEKRPFEAKHLPKSNVKPEDLEMDSAYGKKYGYLPKLKRLQAVHELMAYLVYHYEGKEPEEVNGEQNVKYGESKVYLNENSWKRHLPPLPIHADHGRGWCLIRDIILVLPVAMFCQITRLNYKIQGLLEYLEDPAKKYTLIRDLPTSIQSKLYYARKYIFAFYEKCTWLCQIGLLSFGPREMKEKDQVFIYLHKKAKIVDTIASKAGYNIVINDSGQPFPVKYFNFEKKEDIEKYWFDLQRICLNTPLGLHHADDEDGGSEDKKEKGESKALSKEDRQRAYQRLLPCQESKHPDTVQDTHNIPGDGLGAGGLDSSFFGHLKRNWTWNSRDSKVEWMILKSQLLSYSKVGDREKEEKRQPPPPTRIVLPGVTGILTKPSGKTPAAGVIISEDQKKKGKKRRTLLINEKHEKALKSVKPVKVKGQKRLKGGKGIKRKPRDDVGKYKVKRVTLGQGKIYPRKPYYDADDKKALRRMTKERVEWSAQEDSLLLLCIVASLFLSSPRRDYLVSWRVIRNTMHKFLKSSQDKTSKACQRRVGYVMQHEKTKQNVLVYLAEIMQDKDLVAEFKTGKTYKKTDEETTNNAFHRLLPILLQKFTSMERLQNAPRLPDTLEELDRKYTVSMINHLKQKSVHKDVVCVRQIYQSVVHNLIHSTLTLSDKIGRARELYKLFSQYPDKLLDEVFRTMNTDGIIIKIKTGIQKRNRIREKEVPMLSVGSYQLAQRYEYVFSSRYPKEIFIECKESLDVLKNASPVKTDGEDNEPDSGYEVTLTDSGGHCAAVVSLMAINLITFSTVIPEKVIVIDKQSMVKQVVRRGNVMKAITESDAEDDELIEKAKTSSQERSGDLTDKDVSDKDNVEDSDIADKHVEKNDQECGEENDQEGGVVSRGLSGSNLKFELTTKTASRIMISLVHGQYMNTQNVRNLNPQDHLVIKACRVSVKLKKNGHSANTETDRTAECSAFKPSSSGGLVLDPKISNKTLGEMRVLQPHKLDFGEVVKTLRTSSRFSEEELGRISDLYEDIKALKALGITMKELKEKYQEFSAAYENLQILLSHRLVLRVGVTAFRYVCHEFSRPWLIHSYKNVKGRGTGQAISNEVEANNGEPGTQGESGEQRNDQNSAEECSEPPKEKRSRLESSSSPESLQVAAPAVSLPLSLPASSIVPATPPGTSGVRLKSPQILKIVTSSPVNPFASGKPVVFKIPSNTEGGKQKTFLFKPSVTESPTGSSGKPLVVTPSEEPENPAALRRSQRTTRGKRNADEKSATSCNYQKVRLIIRPWKTPEGTVNRSTLKMMLEAILTFVMSNPGCTDRAIFAKYNPSLQPVPISELLEILEEIGCLSSKCIKQQGRPGIFSKRCQYQLCDDKVGMVVYTATVDCLLRMGQYLSHITHSNQAADKS